ncbi:MAG TPA: hypothetical protein VD905_04230 [Flavobacteriales bacterium]|nr:hypothetical protein [Flavobacteriales bacterium]
MKKTVYLFFVALMFTGCKKETPPQAYTLCESAECYHYLQTWKNLFMQRNNMTAEYFNAHIFPFFSQMQTWDEGVSFNIRYHVKIDWMICSLSDQFIVYIDSDSYPGLGVPRHTFLAESEINQVLDYPAFGSEITTVASLDHLAFPTNNAAWINAASTAGISLGNGSFVYGPAYGLPANGHPYLNCSGTVNESANQCRFISLDLYTAHCQISDEPCAVF